MEIDLLLVVFVRACELSVGRAVAALRGGHRQQPKTREALSSVLSVQPVCVRHAYEEIGMHV